MPYLFLQQEVDNGPRHAIDALLPYQQCHHLLKVVHHSLHIVVGGRLFAARPNHIRGLLPVVLEHLLEINDSSFVSGDCTGWRKKK